MASKSQIDRAGRVLSSGGEYDERSLELDYVFENYRRSHLKPLSELTEALQGYLSSLSSRYYIAHRLKRKPQIIRKLKRFSIRLTQLQDIGGCRIIVDDNKHVDLIAAALDSGFLRGNGVSVARKTDYRERGREESGCRALHYVIEAMGCQLEIQLRSNIQYFWAESIERTSVIYGRHLKEQDGDLRVIRYFKDFSDLLFEVEVGRTPSLERTIALERSRVVAEDVLAISQTNSILHGYVNEDIIRTLAEMEGTRKGLLSNWILVFDWASGNFVTWERVGREPEQAMNAYIRYEREFPAEKNYEVVLIGSSDIATVRQTHSHYFGIESHGSALEDFQSSLIGISRRAPLDLGARRILSVLVRRKYWGGKSINVDTLRNHFCRDVFTFPYSLQALIDKGLLNVLSAGDVVSLDVSKRKEIESFL